MIALSNGLTIFGEPLLLLALIALVFAILEAERAWTRSRRRRGLEPGAMTYLLDGLVIAGIALVLAGGGTLFVQGLTSITELLGGVFDGQRVGLLIIGVAVALGLGLMLDRIARGRRAAQHGSGTGAIVTPPSGLGTSAAEPNLAGASAYQPAYAPMPRERLDDEPVPSLALLQERWQPSNATTASVPTSFLELAEPSLNTRAQARSRFAFAPALLTLTLVVMLVSGAVLFRSQVISVLSRMDTSSGEVAIISDGEGAIQPNTGIEPVAANVSAAVPPAALAPTGASQPAAAAPLPSNDVQGTTKRVKSDGLNVRALPGTDRQVVVVLAKGDAVIVFTDARLIRDTIWVKVRAGDQEGWVDQSLLE